MREVRIGDLVLDLEACSVKVKDQRIQLTPLEFGIFYLLGVNEGRVTPIRGR